MKKSFWFCVSVFIFELVVAACLYPTLPESIPMHWGFDGVADGFGGRWTIFLGPIITSLFMLPFTALMARATQKNDNLRRSEKATAIIAVSTQVLFAGMFAWVVLTIKGIAPDTFTIDKVVFAVLGIVLVVIGNYMPKIKQNTTMGVRTPWTLKSPVVWQKSQRFGGMMFVSAGVLFVMSILLPPYLNLFVPLVYLALCAVALLLYSYMLYKKENKG
jgi:uncharacterized membrane protein